MSIRSIVASFSIILSLLIASSLYYVQTKSFGNLLTKIIADLSEKKLKSSINLESVKLSLYPLGISFRKVQVYKKNQDHELDLELGNLDFFFNLMEIEDRRISFGEIKLSDGLLKYKSFKQSSPISEIPKKWINELFKYPEALPLAIDTISLDNIRFDLPQASVPLKRLKVYKKKNEFKVKFYISNLELLIPQSPKIDEVIGELSLSKKKIGLSKIKINQGVNSLYLYGDIFEYERLKNAKGNLSGEAEFYLSSLEEYLPKLKEAIESGDLKAKFNFTFADMKPSADLDLNVSNFKSSFFNAKSITSNASFKNDVFKVHQFEILDERGKLNLLNQVSLDLFSLENNFKKEFQLKLEKFSIKNSLSFNRGISKLLSGEITGLLKINLNKDKFYINPKDNFEILNFKLGDESPILDIKKINLSNSSLFYENNKFFIFSDLFLNNSKLRVEGYISAAGSKLNVEDSYIDLDDLGGVSGLGIKGKGSLNFALKGNFENIVLKFLASLNDFEILGYKTGSSKLDVDIFLGESKVVINNLDSTIGITELLGNGFVNYNTKEISIGINTPRTNYQDLRKILTPILSNLTFLPQSLFFDAGLDVSIFGKYVLEDLKIRSDVKLKNISIFDESIDQGYFNLVMESKKLQFNNISFSKGKGSLWGDFNFDLNSKSMNSGLKWDNLWLSNFSLLQGFDVDGYIHGDLKLFGKIDDYNLLFFSGLSKTKLGNLDFNDSLFKIILNKNHANVDIDVFGGEIISKWNHSYSKNTSSKFGLKLNTKNLKPILIAFLGKHLNESGMEDGGIDLEVSGGYVNNFKKINLDFWLKSLNFQTKNLGLKAKSDNGQIKIEKDEIKKWDLKIETNDFQLISFANGEIGKNLSVSNSLNFSAKYLELIHSKILLADGFLKNNFIFKNEDSENSFVFNSRSEKVSLSISEFFLPLNDLSYSLSFSNNRLFLDFLKIKLDNGFIAVNGDALWEKEYPDVNLKFQLEKAEIPFLQKSSANISGEGIILGNDIPYVLNGNFSINKLLIANELSDFQKKSVADVKYLPKSQESITSKILKLNVKSSFVNPLRIRNSLMDVSLNGSLTLEGNPLRPIANGRLFTLPNTSRIYFKNNEYLLNNSDINFSPKKDISNPDFDIEATTVISNYKILAKAYGDLERFNFDLSSDPALQKNSILSLIAFGYTDEIQNTLSQDEQQNLTQMGVGSFVFDRFKISDILNKQFGLQINLGTVFEQSQTQSMLSGRSQDSSAGLVGRTRSATKIELKKRLDEATTLSVSSTMGGSIGQRQSMNLTYNVTKKVQLEGIYELKTNADGEEDIIDNSIGGDVKFRWTFK